MEIKIEGKIMIDGDTIKEETITVGNGESHALYILALEGILRVAEILRVQLKLSMGEP